MLSVHFNTHHNFHHCAVKGQIAIEVMTAWDAFRRVETKLLQDSVGSDQGQMHWRSTFSHPTSVNGSKYNKALGMFMIIPITNVLLGNYSFEATCKSHEFVGFSLVRKLSAVKNVCSLSIASFLPLPGDMPPSFYVQASQVAALGESDGWLPPFIRKLLASI